MASFEILKDASQWVDLWENISKKVVALTWCKELGSKSLKKDMSDTSDMQVQEVQAMIPAISIK